MKFLGKEADSLPRTLLGFQKKRKKETKVFQNHIAENVVGRKLILFPR